MAKVGIDLALAGKRRFYSDAPKTRGFNEQVELIRKNTNGADKLTDIPEPCLLWSDEARQVYAYELLELPQLKGKSRQFVDQVLRMDRCSLSGRQRNWFDKIVLEMEQFAKSEIADAPTLARAK